MRARLAACLLALVAISAACGGRSISTETDGQTGGSSSYGASHSSGATASTGATGSYGASSSQGGAPGFAGTTASGGFIGIAGTMSTMTCPPCPLVPCPGGYVQVTNPNGCCYHCECNPMLCPGIGCASGSHLETRPGECCPGCVPDQVPDQCGKQQTAYQEFKKQLVEKYSSLGCMTSNDCTVYYEKNQCAAGCGIVMPVAGINYLDTNLQSYAQQNCGPMCPFPALPPCDAPARPLCFNGRCQ